MWEETHSSSPHPTEKAVATSCFYGRPKNNVWSRDSEIRTNFLQWIQQTKLKQYRYNITHFNLSILCVIVQFIQFQPTNGQNCHLIHNHIFRIKLIHVSDFTGPSTESTLDVVE